MSTSLWFVITTGRGALILIVKDSVSRAPVWSFTWIVEVNRPSVVGLLVMPPEPTPCVNNVRPGGIRPETTLNWTGFSDVRQPVVEKNHVFSVPTFPSAKVSGTIVQVVLDGGGGGFVVTDVVEHDLGRTRVGCVITRKD